MCGNTNLEPIIDLGSMALTGIFPKPGEAVDTSPIVMVKCHSESGESCGLVQLKHTYNLEDLYGENYGYRSGLNHSMVEHLNGIVREIEKRVDLKPGDLVIDIASNDGTLLSAYPKEGGFTLLGIDPTSAKFKEHYPDHIQYIPEFFSASIVDQTVGQKARVITSIAMFYDLEDPVDFVTQIYNTLTDDGIWVFEQSYMPAMVQNTSYDTICHEHLEYYGLKQIKWLMDKVGFNILDVVFSDANGGSFRITVAKKDSDHIANDSLVAQILEKEMQDGFEGMEVYREFTRNVELHKKELVEKIKSIQAEGKKIVGYGASTKGNVILQYCGITENEISCIAEVNEFKFGRVTPGTKIPIISEDEAHDLEPDYFMVLPWHFRDNIIGRESEYLKTGGHLFFPLPQVDIV